MATKQKFLDAYQEEVRAQYAWAQDPDKLERYMASVRATIYTSTTTWIASGEVLATVFKRLGLPWPDKSTDTANVRRRNISNRVALLRKLPEVE